MNRRVLVSVAAVFFLILFPLTPAHASGSGNALDFDGADDYAEGTGISTMTNLTLEAWVYHRTLPSSRERYVTVGDEVAVIRHDGVSQQGQLHFYIKTGGTLRSIRVNGALQLGKRYHVAGTWDGTDMKLYLDGEEVGSSTPGGTLNAPDGGVRLSRADEPMDGYVDEVRIWSVARSPEEIRSNMYTTLSGSESGLESYWKLDESSGSTAYDSAGSVDLTLYNMTNDDWVTSGAFAGPRNALDFDGGDDYVALPAAISNDIETVTVEAWVYSNTLSQSSIYRGIVSEAFTGDGNVEFELFLHGSSHNLSAGFNDGSWHTVSEAAAFPLEGWTHVAATYDGHYIKLYRDGKEVAASSDLSLTLPDGANGWRIGRRHDSGDPANMWNGRIDEVRIWNDVRSPEEIREHMCTTLVGDENNLVGHWRFDQAADTTLYDWSSNGNHGTLTNMSNDDWVACDAFTTWIGWFGTDWATADNWSFELTPTSVSNAGIPNYSGGNQPVIDQNYTCHHLSIHTDASLTVNSGRTLEIRGNVFSSGTQIGGGKLELAGASASHSIAGTLGNVELNESAGAEMAGNTLFDGTLTLTYGAITLNGSSLSYGPSGTLKYNGSSAQITTSVEFPSSNGPPNLTINNANGVTLHDNRTINGTLALTNGDLDLNGSTITLGADAMLNESDGNTVKGDSGTITTTRTFNTGDLSTGENIAGMGAEITTDAGLGETAITCGHSAQTGGGSESILRYFDITPTNNSGLDATLVFHYDDSELNGLTESDLGLGRSTDSGSTWSGDGGTVDTGDETITLGGIDALSRWTAFELGFPHTVTLDGVCVCSVAWGDCDNDGDLDVLLAGDTGSTRVTRVYRNDGAETFTDIGSGLPGVYSCSVAWGDYDSDGDLDVLLAGDTGSSDITRIYRNEGSGTFTEIGAGLPGVRRCSVAWGDYDNDGDLDVLLAGDTGSTRVTRVYRNDGAETFTDIGSGLPGVYSCSVAWGDYDNDGDLDVLLAGDTGSISITRIYRNEGSGTFYDIGAGLPGVLDCSVAWGDYDNDGDLDVLLAGSTSPSISITRIYRNEGSGTFTDISAGLPGVFDCSVAWGDYDNDGDLDVLLAGDTGSSVITGIYRNEGSDTFTQGASLTGVLLCSVAWGDYDNDGDLDVLLAGHTGSSYITRIYRNGGLTTNTVPDAPSNLAALSAGQDVTLSWDTSTDAETAADALTYNLRIGTTLNGEEVMSPMADASTGYRRIPALGNTNHDTTWVVRDLPSGTLHWSVQAIDNAFAGSAFAAEGTFGIIEITTAGVTDITKTTATCGGEVTHEGDSSVTAKGVVWDTSEDPTVGSHLGITNDGSGTGSFVSSLTGLTAGQTYYVRAYATNSQGTVYGETKVFAPNMTPPGNGLDFDGSDDYVALPTTISEDIDSLTVEAWVYSNTLSEASDYRAIVTEAYAGDGNVEFELFLDGSSHNLSAGFYDGSWHTLSDAAAFPVGEWVHVAATYDGHFIKLYRDGQEVATSPDLSLPLPDGTDGWRIGRRHDSGGASNLWNGSIDEVRIWSAARSQTDIQTDMNQIMNGDETGLVAYYRFDHLSGTALSDRTTNDNDGTLMNMDDADWVLSAAAIGHESHVGLGTSNLVENTDVPADITWDADPGTEAIFAAIQVDDIPDATGGLPTTYSADTYWELWIAHDDGAFQADAAFHYDNLSGIWDETALALYTRTAPGQSWSLVSGTTTDYEGSTSDGVGSITANDLTAFSQFIIGGGNEMTLTGTVHLDTLVLEWSTVSPASAYWVYGDFNEPHFDPELLSPYAYRVAVTADTTWSSPAGIADPDTNWTYQVIAVDGTDTELVRTNRFGEHDFEIP